MAGRGGRGSAETKLYLVVFQISDELEFFNAALALGRRRPPGIRLRHWFIADDGKTSYAVWEAGEVNVLLGVLDVEFGPSASFDVQHVNLLYG